MATENTTSLFPNTVAASPIDHGRNLLNSLIVDASRKPYVLARIALSGHAPEETTELALRGMHEANVDGVLQPPLSDSLANELEAFLVERQSGRRIPSGNFAAMVLLSMALDEGSQH